MAATDYLQLGGGELYFAEKQADGSFDDYKKFGMTDSISVNLSTETLEHVNTEGATPTTDMEIEKKKTIAMNVETSEISQEMVKRFFKGSTSTVTQVSGSVSGQSMTVKKGYVYDLGHQKVSNVVVKDSGGSTTYVEGTDYAVDTGAGILKILEGGSIGTAIQVDYDYADATYTVVEAGTETTIEGKMRFVSEPAVGIKRIWDFHKVSIVPSGDMALKSAEDWAKATFEIKVLKDDTVTSGSQFFKVTEVAS